MPPRDCLISLADLSAVGLRLQTSEAVAVTRDITLRAQRGDLPGIPSAHVIRFSSDGTIDIEGPVAAGRSVERAARLLDAMLPGFDAPPEMRAPGALRLVLGRALGTLDLPAYASLDEFAEAMARFSVPDTAAAVKHLWERGTVAVCLMQVAANALGNLSGLAAETESEWTISDVRRARRSTGLTLSEISERSRIPVSLLRELEWGYFVNWPDGHYGRAQLIRYARAAGLDDDVVIEAVWPMVQEAARTRSATAPARVIDGAIIDEAPAESESLVRIEPAVPALGSRQSSRRRSRLLPALAIPALLAIGLIPAIWTWDDGVGQPAAVTGTSTPLPPASDRAGEAPVDARSNVEPRAPESVASVPEPSAPEQSAAESPPSDRPSRVTTAAKSALEPAAPIGALAGASFSLSMASAGSAMFYQSPTGDSSAIMRADTDASGAVLQVTSIVNDHARNYHARSSPDGQMIAFDSDREGERAVYVADATGRDVRRVSGDGFAAIPSWSPDASRIAYVRAEPDQPEVWNIWVADLETGERHRVTSHSTGRPWGAAWFPGGERIAYGLAGRLIVRAVEGPMQRVYRLPGDRTVVRTPAVSPDSRHVIFQVERDGGWLLNVSDASMRRILTDPTAEAFAWAPDGRRVAYHSRKTGDWGIWVMADR